MCIEINILEDNGRCNITSLPKVIGSEWFYKLKSNANICIESHKACLIVLGDMQVEGIYYGKTFSIVAKITEVKFVRHKPKMGHFSKGMILASRVSCTFMVKKGRCRSCHGIYHWSDGVSQPRKSITWGKRVQWWFKFRFGFRVQGLCGFGFKGFGFSGLGFRGFGFNGFGFSGFGF